MSNLRKLGFSLRVLLLGMSLYAGTAHASLIGSTITGVDLTGLEPTNATVGAGVEFVFISDITFDFGADTLTITHDQSHGHSWGDFGYIVFTGFDTTITGISLLSITGFAGDFLSNFSFTSSSVTVHAGVGNTAPFGQLVFKITSVPEPATLSLLGLGLLGLGLARRRKSA